MTDTPISFEGAFKRLEAILEKMNSAALPLDEALSLYEEADRLLALCFKQLQSAEKKVQVLIKNRQNDLVLDENERPQMQPYEVR